MRGFPTAGSQPPASTDRAATRPAAVLHHKRGVAQMSIETLTPPAAQPQMAIETYTVPDDEIERRRLIGHVSVDSGLLLLIDPCYVIGGTSPHGRALAAYPWEEFFHKRLEPQLAEGPAAKVLNNLALVVGNACGDGSYPVYADLHEGRPISVTIQFCSEPVEAARVIPAEPEEATP
jgi:hypothetical protein